MAVAGQLYFCRSSVLIAVSCCVCYWSRLYQWVW